MDYLCHAGDAAAAAAIAASPEPGPVGVPALELEISTCIDGESNVSHWSDCVQADELGEALKAKADQESWSGGPRELVQRGCDGVRQV